MLFCDSEGLPITQHLPEDHEGREIYGFIEDPDPGNGRALARLEEKQGRTINKSNPRGGVSPPSKAPDAPGDGPQGGRG